MARVSIAKKETHEDMSGVTINFQDGTALTVNLDSLSDDIVRHLALHGLSQKLGDSYAGESDIDVARAKATAVGERLASGDWKAVREGGGGARISDLANALATVTQKPVEDCVTLIADMDKTQKSGLRKHPKIAAELAQIAAKRAADKAEKAGEAGGAPDLGSLLD